MSTSPMISSRADHEPVPTAPTAAGSPQLAAAARASAATRGFESLCLAICHDLRGPVATAGEAVRSLERSLALQGGDAQRKHGELAAIAGLSLAKAGELLDSLPALLTHERTARRTTVCLDDLLRSVRADVDVELALIGGALHVRGRLPRVLADRERLRIALRNLVRNAIRYRRPEVRLEVSVRAWKRGASRTITVSDNGIGIPPRGRARVFEPFHRVGSHAVGTGFGLGLAIARRAIEASGGTIAVSSRQGVGTSFAITLAAADEPAR